jgi:hypothetical protein
LIMEPVSTFEMLVNFCKTTGATSHKAACHIQNCLCRNTRRDVNLKSHRSFFNHVKLPHYCNCTHITPRNLIKLTNTCQQSCDNSLT